jgi:hypothetical protein
MVPPIEMHYRAALQSIHGRKALNDAALKEAEDYLLQVKSRLDASR